jgi:hypothetical protein
MRHALAGGLISRRISPGAARTAHWLNENILGLGQPWTERRMDDYNTELGIVNAPKYASDQEFIENFAKQRHLLNVLNKSHRQTKEEELYAPKIR